MSLPESILEEVGHEALAEDVALDIFRRRVPDIRFSSLIEQDREAPFVLIRKSTSRTFTRTDRRFVETYDLTAEIFADGIDADSDAPLIVLAMRNALKRAAMDGDEVLNGFGWVTHAYMTAEYARRADYANSEGPVQYADLPQEWVRYFVSFRITVKRSTPGLNIYS